MQIVKRQIYITDTIEGFHCWEDAPEEVMFLRANHRHLFHIKCYFDVNHDDRDLEFFIMKRIVRQELEKLFKFNVGSCEMIANHLIQVLGKYPIKKVEVSEDGENGAILEV